MPEGECPICGNTIAVKVGTCEICANCGMRLGGCD